ncbi:MAG: tRNA (adenosine(37)-N6)-threonylcarbamoyltransferase complex dimerization subunit type 1 TsaB [Bacteroidales bacterium]
MAKNDPLILSIESSGEICSVALSQGGHLLAQRKGEEKREHASIISILAKEAIEEGGSSIESLDAVAVSEGPGSYTGLRVGLSFAKGLSFALEIPLIAISTLDILVEMALTSGAAEGMDSIVPVIDARRMEVYTATYSNRGKRVSEVVPLIVEEDSFDHLLKRGKVLFCGDGAEKLRLPIKSKNGNFVTIYPLAEGMVELALESYKRSIFVDYVTFEPLYLKEFIAGKRKNLLG